MLASIVFAIIIAAACAALWYCIDHNTAEHDHQLREAMLEELSRLERGVALNGWTAYWRIRDRIRAQNPKFFTVAPSFMRVVNDMEKDGILTVTQSNEHPRDLHAAIGAYVSPRWVDLMLTTKGRVEAQEIGSGPRSDE